MSAPDLPAQLVRQGQALSRLALALTQDPGHADDIVQESLLARIDSAPPDDRMAKAWLRRVVRNLALSGFRSQRRRRYHEQVASRPESQPSAEQELERVELQQCLLAHVASLPPDQAQVISLRFWEGLPPRAIAARLGLGIETVKARQKRALARLRQQLDSETSGGREAWLSGMLPLSGLAKSQAMYPLAPLVLMKVSLAVVAFFVLILGSWSFFKPSSRSLSVIHPESTSEDFIQATASAPEVNRVTSKSVRRPGLAPQDQGANLRVRVVRANGGAPFEEVSLRMWRPSREPGHTSLLEAQTDRDGTAHFVGLEVGATYDLHSDRGPNARWEAKAGDHALSLEIPEGLHLRGQVSDPDGNPIPDASVWIQRFGAQRKWGASFPCARSDSEGRFEVRDAPVRGSVVVRHRSYAPSQGQALWDRGPGLNGVTELNFTLQAQGHRVEGRVVDPQGQPVPFALVWILDHQEVGMTCDGQGRFVFEGLSNRFADTWAWAPGWAPTRQRARHANERVITLVPARTLEGRVLADGQPVTGARVRLATALGNGWMDWSPFSPSSARTDDQGRFLLDGLTAGPCAVIAQHPGRSEHLVETVLMPQGPNHLEIRFPTGMNVEGRVVDQQGAGVAGVLVGLQAAHDWVVHVETDQAGDFQVRGAPRGAIDVHLYGPSSSHSGGPISTLGVSADDWPLTLVWPSEPKGEVRSAFLDRQKKAGSDYQVFAVLHAAGSKPLGSGYGERVPIGSGAQRQAKAGSIHFRGVEPGLYRIGILASHEGIASSPVFEVKPGEVAEVPLIETSITASARIQIAPAHALDEGSYVYLRQLEDGWTAMSKIASGEAVFPQLLPGTWRVSVHSPGYADDGLELVLEAGDQGNGRLNLFPVTRTQLQPICKQRTLEDWLLSYTVTSTETPFQRSLSGAVDHQWDLLPGPYELIVEHRLDNWSIRGRFTVPDPPGPDLIEVILE